MGPPSDFVLKQAAFSIYESAALQSPESPSDMNA